MDSKLFTGEITKKKIEIFSLTYAEVERTGGKKTADLTLHWVVFVFFVSRKSVQVGGAPMQDEATQLMIMTQTFSLL